jgi:cell division protein FtsB
VSKTETPLKRKAVSLALFLILAASALNALFGDRGLLVLLKVRQEIEALDQEIAMLRAENQMILEEIRSLKTSPLAVERLARENLGLVKPGEVVLLIRETEVGPTAGVVRRE